MPIGEPFEQASPVAGGQFNPIVGPTLASTTSISPTYGIHPISGTEVIKYINPPYAEFKGQLVFLPTGAWTTSVTTGTSGNIATAAITATTAVPVIAVFNGTSWYLK